MEVNTCVHQQYLAAIQQQQQQQQQHQLQHFNQPAVAILNLHHQQHQLQSVSQQNPNSQSQSHHHHNQQQQLQLQHQQQHQNHQQKQHQQTQQNCAGPLMQSREMALLGAPAAAASSSSSMLTNAPSFIKKELLANGKKTKGRVRIKTEFIHNKLRRYTTFSKRKTGIMKKAYELATLTGTQVMLLVASETGHVYTFATRKLQPMIISDAGKALIQTCLNSPDSDNLLMSALSTSNQTAAAATLNNGSSPDINNHTNSTTTANATAIDATTSGRNNSTLPSSSSSTLPSSSSSSLSLPSPASSALRNQQASGGQVPLANNQPNLLGPSSSSFSAAIRSSIGANQSVNEQQQQKQQQQSGSTSIQSQHNMMAVAAAPTTGASGSTSSSTPANQLSHNLASGSEQQLNGMPVGQVHSHQHQQQHQNQSLDQDDEDHQHQQQKQRNHKKADNTSNSSGSSTTDQRMSATGYEETELSYGIGDFDDRMNHLICDDSILETTFTTANLTSSSPTTSDCMLHKTLMTCSSVSSSASSSTSSYASPSLISNALKLIPYDDDDDEDDDDDDGDEAEDGEEQSGDGAATTNGTGHDEHDEEDELTAKEVAHGNSEKDVSTQQDGQQQESSDGNPNSFCDNSDDADLHTILIASSEFDNFAAESSGERSKLAHEIRTGSSSMGTLLHGANGQGGSRKRTTGPIGTRKQERQRCSPPNGIMQTTTSGRESAPTQEMLVRAAADMLFNQEDRVTGALEPRLGLIQEENEARITSSTQPQHQHQHHSDQLLLSMPHQHDHNQARDQFQLAGQLDNPHQQQQHQQHHHHLDQLCRQQAPPTPTGTYTTANTGQMALALDSSSAANNFSQNCLATSHEIQIISVHHHHHEQQQQQQQQQQQHFLPSSHISAPLATSNGSLPPFCML